MLLAASANVWLAASEDEVTALAVERAPLDRNGIDIAIESRFAADTLEAADVEVIDALAAIPEMGTTTRTVYTLPGLLTIGPSPLRQVGPAGRLLARDGALESVDIVEQSSDTTGGVWVTTWFAERHGLSLGDGLGFEAGAIVDDEWNDLVRGGGTNSVFPIVGFYEPLWSTDPDHQLDDYWSLVPPEPVPVYIGAFGGPNSELVLAEEATVLTSGLTGVVRWRAPLASIPDTFDELRVLRNRLRRVDADLVGTGSLAAAMSRLATAAGRRPVLTTDLYETTSSVEAAAGRLSTPLASARALGGIVGLIATVAVGVFLVERRRTEFRLLASEGERWPTMSARVGGQLIAPIAVGGAVAIVAALAGPRWLGPAERFEFDALPWRLIVGVALASWIVASVTAGVLGSRTLRSSDRRAARAVGLALLALLLLATLAAWVQVGRTAAIDSESLDLVVVALPVLVVLVSVVVLLGVVSRLLVLLGRRVERLPVAAYLALRRLASGSVGIRMVAGALGAGIGLLVFAVALTSTLGRTIDVKLATEIGGETSISLVDELPPGFRAPAATTVIRTSDTLLSPDRQRARIIAIDPATYRDAVIWPDQFGSDLDSVIESLGAPIDESIPVVGVRGEPAADGAFGLTQTFPFRVVDRVGSFPGAGENEVTLLVLADSVDEFALAAGGYADEAAAAEANVRLPVSRYRRTLISQASPDELIPRLDAAGVRYRNVATRAARSRDPGIAATRSAFEYLGVIGVVAGTAAVVALAMFLEARRRGSALVSVMTQSMGLRPASAALVSVLELAAVVLVAVGAGFIAAPIAVRRLSGRFDPAPERPPHVPVLVSWLPLVGIALVGVAGLAVVVWFSEHRAARRFSGEVLRDAG